MAKSKESIVIFDGSFDGFLCIIFAFYYEKIMPIQIQHQALAQLTLSGGIYYVEADIKKAEQVIGGIRNKISNEALQNIYYALMSYEDNKYMAIFEYVIAGFKLGHMIDSHLQMDCVRKVHKLAKHVGREAHLLLGFCRFAEISYGGGIEPHVITTQPSILYATISPKNDVLVLVAEHFTQRLMNNPWIIHDTSRNLGAIYDGQSYIITPVPKNANIAYSQGEENIQELWRTFFKSLTIDSRLNPKLQRQLMPLYFRKNMTEFR